MAGFLCRRSQARRRTHRPRQVGFSAGKSPQSYPAQRVEVILQKNNSNISFKYVDSSIEYEISLPKFRTGYCVSKDNNEIIKREFETYEDGTKLYYSYNPIFSNPLEYTCLFDYNPR